MMILFFYGEEDFLAEKKVKELKNNFLAKDTTGSGLCVFDFGEEIEFEDLIDNFSEQNLFSESKLIIVKSFFENMKADDQNNLLDVLKKTDLSDNLIFWEKIQPRKNGRLFKWLIKNAKIYKEFSKIQGRDLSNWIKKNLQNIDEKIFVNNDVIQELIFLTGSDLRRIDIELRKLASYVGEGEISLEDVHKLTTTKVKADIFQTIELAFRNDKKRALLLLKQQLAKGDDPFYIFSMYVYQIRVLLKILGCMKIKNNANEYSIAKETKFHPFVVKKSLILIRNSSDKNLLKAHKFLLNLDREVKLGKRDIGSALDLFITMSW